MAKNAVGDWSTTAGDNTDIGGVSLAEGSGGMRIPATNNAFRAIMAQIKTAIGVSFQAYSASLTAIAAAFTAASSAGAASLAFAEDTDNGTNKATLKGPAALGADITVTLPSSTGTVALTSDFIGTHTIWVPAYAMISTTTSGAAEGTAESSSNKIMYRTKDFDASAEEFVQFLIRMPKSWNEGTVTAAFTWMHGATTTNFGVAWALEGVAISNDDAGDAAWGTEVVVTDTGGTTDDVYVTAATSAVTIGGTPQAEDLVAFRITRVVGNGSDNMAVDAKLIGCTIYYTTDAGTDA